MVTLIRNLFLLATTLFILASISFRLTLLSLVVVPPLVLGLRDAHAAHPPALPRPRR